MPASTAPLTAPPRTHPMRPPNLLAKHRGRPPMPAPTAPPMPQPTTLRAAPRTVPRVELLTLRPRSSRFASQSAPSRRPQGRRFSFWRRVRMLRPSHAGQGGPFMRAGVCVLLMALLPTAVAAQWSDLGMSYVKTKDLDAGLLRFGRLSRAARRAHVHELARMAATDLRLDAFGARDHAAQGLFGLRERLDVVGAAQLGLRRHRTSVARFRDVSGNRAHVHADEPRARALRAG